MCNKEPPNTSPQMVWFDLDAGDDFNTIDPQNLMLRWDPYNLTMNLEASVTVSLWGYRVRNMSIVLFYAILFEL